MRSWSPTSHRLQHCRHENILSLTSALCSSVITHPYSMIPYLCSQVAHHMPAIFSSHLLRRGTKRCHSSLGNVLAPTEALRNRVRTHLASLAYGVRAYWALHIASVAPSPPQPSGMLMTVVLHLLSFKIHLHTHRLSHQCDIPVIIPPIQVLTFFWRPVFLCLFVLIAVPGLSWKTGSVRPMTGTSKVS